MAKVWVWNHEKISVYLLDTDCEENHPDDRKITNDLYTDIRDDRLRQEILLGIGGMELLKIWASRGRSPPQKSALAMFALISDTYKRGIVIING